MAYRRPNTHQIPNEVCDKHMKDLSGSEFKVLYLIARKTCGFHREVEAIGTDRICRFTGLSKESVRLSVKALEDQGLISRQLQYDANRQVYGDTLYWLAVEDEDGNSERPEGLPSPPTLKNGGPLPQKMGDPLPQNLGSLKGTKETSTKETVEPSPTPQLGSLPELQNPAELADTLSALRRSTRAGHIKGKEFATLRERLPGMIGQFGSGEIEEAFKSFLLDDYWRERKFAISGFISQCWKYIPSNSPGIASALPPARHAPAALREDVPVQPPPARGLVGQIDFVARWNELVPESPVDAALMPKNPKPFSDPLFAERFEQICQKARALITAGADLKFGFLLQKEQNHDRYRWQALLAGELTWMKPRGKAQANSVVDEIRKELGI